MWAMLNLVPPIKWRAGYSGSGDAKTEFFFDCAGCQAKEPVMGGFIAKQDDPTFNGIGMARVAEGPCGLAPAMYCVECWAKKTAELQVTT